MSNGKQFLVYYTVGHKILAPDIKLAELCVALEVLPISLPFVLSTPRGCGWLMMILLVHVRLSDKGVSHLIEWCPIKVNKEIN